MVIVFHGRVLRWNSLAGFISAMNMAITFFLVECLFWFGFHYHTDVPYFLSLICLMGAGIFMADHWSGGRIGKNWDKLKEDK